MFQLFGKDKDVKIRFYFSEETNKQRFTVYDSITIERLQNGERSSERMYILMSHFMVDDNNQPLGESKGMKKLEQLSLAEFEDVAKQFMEAFQNTGVNPPNGNGSTSPSALGQVTETLPAGSVR